MPDACRYMPKWPPVGGVRFHVLKALHDRSAVCRMEWARDFDVYEVANRIGELKGLGWPISNRPCKRHDHRAQIVEYFLEREDQPTLF